MTQITPKRRILLADDHAVVREGIKRLLEHQPDFEVVGECSDGSEVLREVERLRPDVVMMDISMPGTNGLEATRRVRETHPDTRVIAITVHEDEGYVRELLKAGAVGYLLKRAPTEELIRAVRAVAYGGIYIDARVTSTAVKALLYPGRYPERGQPDLSERETSVLRGIARGYSNKEIGTDLNLSVKTVETYKARAMEKLGLRSRVDIVRLACERGWLAAAPAS